MMRILAVSVVYQPEQELLLRSLASFAGDVEAIWVWRNSSLSEELERALLQIKGVSLQGSGENVGIAKALNAAAAFVRENGFDALLTMDQDSVWHGFRDFCSAVKVEYAPIGVYAPIINGLPAKIFAEVDTAFTSGMLIPVFVLEKVGGWCENFLVDGVDNEFCLHARSLGIPVWQVPGGALEHQLGRVEIKRFLGRQFRTYNYSPERLYGIYRNNLIAIKKYPSVSGNFARQFRRVWFWKRPVRMLLGEQNLRAKFAAIRRGIRDARRAK